MKWYKKKGLWFSVGFELLCGLICFLGSMALILGWVMQAVIGAVVLGIIALIAAGGDISV